MKACQLTDDPAVCLRLAKENPEHESVKGMLSVACSARFEDGCRLLHDEYVKEGDLGWAGIYARSACDSGDMKMCDQLETYAGMEAFAGKRESFLERVKAARAKFGAKP